MRSSFLKKSASLSLIVMILAASCLCSCLVGHAAQQSPAAPVATECGAADHCPGCPVDDQSDSDHDTASCFCSCHLLLTVQALHVRHSPVIAALVFFESFTAMPEVYFPKFIPPQNLA